MEIENYLPMLKKLLISVTLFSMLFSLTAVVFLWPENVKAQKAQEAIPISQQLNSTRTKSLDSIPTLRSVAAPGLVTADIGARLMTILKTVWETIKIYGENAAALTYTNGIKYLFNRVAYDYATKLATGGKGQQPLYVDLPFDKYLQKVGDEALGVAFVEIGKTWGVNFCQPIDRPFLKAQLDIYARSAFEPQRPPCDWVDIKKNVGDLKKIQFNDLFGVSTAFHPGANDFGIYLTMVDQARQKQILQKETAKINQQANQGFKNLESTITGKIKTPAAFYSGYAAGMISDSLKPYGVYTGEAAADAIGLFTNTLVSKLLNRAFTKGMNPAADTNRTIVLNLFGSLSSGPAATDQFAELLKPDYNVGGEINVVNELSASCGTSEYGGAQYCNTIDTTFATAIEQKNTVAELAKKKPNAVFGFNPTSQTEPSFRDGFPMRSILILRKYRIVPVGWELAAEYIKNFNKDAAGAGVKMTLQDLLDAYDNPESPFYRLVDPNWQLKAPITVCDLEGPGPDVVSTNEVCDRDTSFNDKIECPPDEFSTYIVRNTYCAKERSCIAESDNGKDCNEFGYCVAEKPIWRIQGSSCPSYFNSCQSLTSTGLEEAAYLTNTLESCGAAGCNAYCKNLNPTDDTWACPTETSLRYYASEQACDAREEGCQALTRILNPNQTPLSQQQASALVSGGFNNPNAAGYLATDVNLKLAPEYANPAINGCAGYTTIEFGLNQAACVADGHYWREDIKQCVLSGNKYCANFALSCAEDDVSCRLYTPVTIKSPVVSAVINQRKCTDGTNSCTDADVLTGNWNDECPAVCVGFRTYTQKETNFEAGVAAESFLSTTATKCTEAGCDEFTNLDEVARGGEGREYFSYLRMCVNPTDPDVQTFYTWEGSDTSGFQLKKWQLQASGNTPVGTVCNFGAAGIDCREVYNSTTNQYYAVDFATVIFAAEDCHPYRRTIANQTDCETTNGKWTTGQCLYMAMPSLSTRCQANNAGCRLYRDNSSYNYQVILSDDFEGGSVEGWTAGTISNESVRRGGHSLHLADNTEHKLNNGDLVAGGSYVLSFLAKGTGSATFAFSLASGTNVISGTVSGTITNEWQLFDGQAAVNFGELPAGDYTDSILRIENMGDLYLDNVVLKKIDNILFIKNSWTAAPVCDNIIGMSSCEAYKDNTGRVWNLQKFSKLCLEEVVGCEVFGQKNTAGVLQPVYYVYDRNKLCQTPGCAKLGLLARNRFNPTDTAKFSFTDTLTVIKQNQTCTNENESCVNYKYTGGAALYKNPSKRVCEFKDYNGQFGWWIAGEEGKTCPSSNGYCYNNTSVKCTVNTNCVTGTGDFCVTTNGYCYNNTSKNCVSDANCGTGDFCVSSKELSGEQKYCLGGRSATHPDSNICNGNNDCIDYITFAQSGICTSWSALCDGAESGCQEYQDPYVPELCDASLLPYQYSSLYNVYGANQTPACEYYWYKNVESVGNESGTACDLENIDPTKHCFLRTGER